MGRRHSIITSSDWDLIRANLFPAALPAVGDWRQFPWHTSAAGGNDTWKVHSSQALVIDVMGSLIAAPGKDSLLNALASHWGLNPAGGWQVHLEWLDPQNILREPRRSQIDAIACDSQNLIFFECKFTERQAGACSQPGLVRGVRQCNGNYELQTNPLNGKTARCALSAKGIRYWELIPAVFDLAADADYQPCPFAGSWYQWMRNLVVCQAAAQQRGLSPAFVILYAGGPFSIAQELESDAWHTFLAGLREGGITMHWMTYQQLIDIACAALDPAEAGTWHSLGTWVELKISLASQNIK